MEGVTDAMKQYSKATEEIIKNKPKRGKPYGIKRPSSEKLVAALAAIFAILVLAGELIG